MEPEYLLPPEMAVIDRLHTRKHVRSERCRECHQPYPCHARMVIDVLQRVLRAAHQQQQASALPGRGEGRRDGRC